MMDIQIDAHAIARLAPGEIAALTAAATASTSCRDAQRSAQLAADRRIIEVSEFVCRHAVISAHQRLAAAFVADEFAGYVVATRRAPDDRELDWMMVHPRHHGAGVAGALMVAGLTWLDPGKPVRLNVIRHNTRAIAFCRKFGFEIDPDARTPHLVPHWIMRRPPGPLPAPFGRTLHIPTSSDPMVTPNADDLR